MTRLNRRDFLKTSVALLAGSAFASSARMLSSVTVQNSEKPNILIFVFDAMSARNLSLYGYERETTPNLNRFASRAAVYHNHFAAGNFTTSGTASMLTGLYPWTHRAINYRGMVARQLAGHNFFNLIGGDYTRFAFTQNLWADILLSQFAADLDVHLRCDMFSHSVESSFQPDDLPGDRGLAYYAFQDFFNLRVVDPHPFPGSLMVAASDLARALASDRKHISDQYPRGLPTNYDYSYENASILDGIKQLIQDPLARSEPYLAYFHLWSPHDPYNPRQKFIGRFDDNLKLPAKPRHPFAASNYSEEKVQKHRREYDEFIADLDAEFGRIMTELETSGVLQNTYIIVTSDHGELFERGEVGHATALLYAPVTQIPLLIAAPGQMSRTDVRSLTSNIDLLPTLMQIAGKEIPDWVEGKVLPEFGGSEDPSRSVFSMMAKDNPAFQPLGRGTFALMKDAYELFYFTGYPGHEDAFELYNLQDDPHELHDLFSRDITTATRMKDELLRALDTANRSFQTNQ